MALLRKLVALTMDLNSSKLLYKYAYIDECHDARGFRRKESRIWFIVVNS